MKRLIVLVLLVACDDDRRVEIHAANSTHIIVDTGVGFKTQHEVAEVHVEVNATPSIVLVPMPIPYEKQPVTAEKPESK